MGLSQGWAEYGPQATFGPPIDCIHPMAAPVVLCMGLSPACSHLGQPELRLCLPTTLAPSLASMHSFPAGLLQLLLGLFCFQRLLFLLPCCAVKRQEKPLLNPQPPRETSRLTCRSWQQQETGSCCWSPALLAAVQSGLDLPAAALVFLVHY